MYELSDILFVALCDRVVRLGKIWSKGMLGMNDFTDASLQSSLFLATKHISPHLRENAVARRALLQRLDESLMSHHLLLCAPAGFGKTTLLAQWLYRCQQQVAWLSLDDSDNNPTRFLSSLIAAL